MQNEAKPARRSAVFARWAVAFALLVTTATLRAEEAAEPPEAATSPAQSLRSPRVIEEIIVTANRRSQNLQEFTGGIQVFDGEALEKAGSSGFEDYVFQIPGADFVDTGSTKKVSLRGISNLLLSGFAAGGTASPIGIYLNDTPIQGNGNLPDLDLYDLERIEVLKGPQGTLYGEGAQGGAFKMLLNGADPSALAAKVEVGVGQTVNGSGFDNFQKAAVNVPVLGSWAVRLVGTRREDQGFVDYFNRGKKGENDATNLMGRVHVDGDLWEGFSASAYVLHQRQRIEQFPVVQLEEGDLRNRFTEPQFADADFTLGALTLDYDLGFAELTSASSLFWNDGEALRRSPFVGSIVDGQLKPITGEGSPVQSEQEWVETTNRQFGVAQELRLVSSGDSWLDWVAGAFYRKRDNHGIYLISNTENEDTPPPAGPGVVAQDVTETFEQFALFGELNVELPWNLELLLGLRAFREEVSLEGAAIYRSFLYPFAVASGEPDGVLPPVRFSVPTTAITPKLSLSWFADESRMVYALVANGVRSGGTNTNALISSVPPVFDPDSVWTYEIGAKTSWIDGLLVANLAVFYNNWKDLQVGTRIPASLGPIPGDNFQSPLILNAARAYSMGLELELSALPFEDLALGFNLFLGEGEIVEGDPAETLADHTPLPQLAALSYSGFDGVTFPLEGFQTYNATVGFANDQWEISFGGTNLTDERFKVGVSADGPDTLTVGRPRSWLTRLAYRF